MRPNCTQEEADRLDAIDLAAGILGWDDDSGSCRRSRAQLYRTALERRAEVETSMTRNELADAVRATVHEREIARWAQRIRERRNRVRDEQQTRIISRAMGVRF